MLGLSPPDSSVIALGNIAVVAPRAVRAVITAPGMCLGIDRMDAKTHMDSTSTRR